jgi:predicted short-subunit dehydrogenase-like oxidoreductase (DUF2520 family)
MIRITIIGSGNVAQHLMLAFDKSNEIEVSQVFSRKKEAVAHLIDATKIIDNFNALVEADLYIIAVSDDAISEISSQLPFENRLVVYPLQTFSKSKAVDFSTIPICLESNQEIDYELLQKIAQTISKNTYKINGEQRKSLHVAAVFVNNFVNHLYQIGNEICIENEVSFDVLKPLILETANKVMMLSPNEAQTGPAKRNDQSTIQTHLDFLKNKNHNLIYKILTQSIQNNGKEL